MSVSILNGGGGRLDIPFRGPWGCSAILAACAFVSMLALSVLACTANPATGRRQLNFYSQADEIQLARQSDEQVRRQLGLVDDPKLQGWVSAIGKRLAAQSERPDLPWSFEVVDDPAVNAFAVPGGFVYVTRGILGHLSTDGELAAVLGHEIGHVTAQHSVNQMSKQQLAVGGLLVGMALSPDLARAGEVAQQGLGLLFLKFSRDDESQADNLGMRYVLKAGYEPREMPKVFALLDRVSAASGSERIPNWLATHPNPVDREQRAEKHIAEHGYPHGEVGEADYLRHVDGLVFGADPRQGYFEGRRFVHPSLGFEISVPAGWSAANETSRVVASHPDKIAQVELRLDGQETAHAAAQKFFAQQGLEVQSQEERRRHGGTAIEAAFRLARDNASTIDGRVAFVELGGNVVQLLGVALDEKLQLVDADLRGFVDGLAPWTGRSRPDVEPQRVHIVEVPQAMTLGEFARRFSPGAKPETLALINGLDGPSSTLHAGARAKAIEGRTVGTQRVGPALR